MTRRKPRGNDPDVHWPFGDEPMIGGPMPAERADGRSLLGEVISTINFRGAAPLVLIALGLVMVVIVVGTLLS